jgi:hypothetical protein
MTRTTTAQACRVATTVKEFPSLRLKKSGGIMGESCLGAHQRNTTVSPPSRIDCLPCHTSMSKNVSPSTAKQRLKIPASAALNGRHIHDTSGTPNPWGRGNSSREMDVRTLRYVHLVSSHPSAFAYQLPHLWVRRDGYAIQTITSVLRTVCSSPWQRAQRASQGGCSRRAQPRQIGTGVRAEYAFQSLAFNVACAREGVGTSLSWGRSVGIKATWR